jgi:hypothetical protein
MKNRIDSQCIHAVQISPCLLTRFARNYSFSFIRIGNVCIRLLHFFHQRVRLDVPPIEFRTSPPRFSSLPPMLARPSFLLFHHPLTSCLKEDFAKVERKHIGRYWSIL